jgi:hypothetical protein
MSRVGMMDLAQIDFQSQQSHEATARTQGHEDMLNPAERVSLRILNYGVQL